MLKPEFVEYLGQHEMLLPLRQDLLTEPSVSVRFNLAKGDVPEEVMGVKVGDAVPWCRDAGRYLDERPAFTMDPGLHQGIYYVQDASSMAVTAAIRTAESRVRDLRQAQDDIQRCSRSLTRCSELHVLDACAAPGGKTTAVISALPDDAVVVANEYDFRRAEILAENVAKWGSPNTVVTRGDTSKFRKLKETFDIIVVDAPCSGEGMMRKDEQARQQWSLALVDQCATLQREILSNVWEALKPGGVLIYSTCTFNRHENEHNVEWLISEYGAESIEVPELDACKANGVASGIDTDANCYRFFPGRVRGEGLFLAAVRKPGEFQRGSRSLTRCSDMNGEFQRGSRSRTRCNDMNGDIQRGSRSLTRCSEAAQWLRGDFSIVSLGDDVFALPEASADFMLSLKGKLDVLSMGVWLGTTKGKDLVPAHALALSTTLNREAFTQCEVDYDTAIAYLQRQAIAIEAPKGFVLLTYQGHPLGFVKNLGNRANNLYPKNWRIRTQK